MAHHTFAVIEGGEPPTTVWDSKAEVALGVSIRRYLAENPAPDDSLFARDMERWANRLLEHGRAGLEDAGERFLSAAVPDLSDAQRDGYACVHCGDSPDRMVPVGSGPDGQVFACADACEPKGER